MNRQLRFRESAISSPARTDDVGDPRESGLSRCPDKRDEPLVQSNNQLDSGGSGVLESYLGDEKFLLSDVWIRISSYLVVGNNYVSLNRKTWCNKASAAIIACRLDQGEKRQADTSQNQQALAREKECRRAVPRIAFTKCCC